ncbi:MAG: hypothetical protein WC764_03280 [Candidatus Paceibacterota bacterium]|jgi:hypothetical protein
MTEGIPTESAPADSIEEILKNDESYQNSLKRLQEVGVNITELVQTLCSLDARQLRDLSVYLPSMIETIASAKNALRQKELEKDPNYKKPVWR